MSRCGLWTRRVVQAFVTAKPHIPTASQREGARGPLPVCAVSLRGPLVTGTRCLGEEEQGARLRSGRLGSGLPASAPSH